MACCRPQSMLMHTQHAQNHLKQSINFVSGHLTSASQVCVSEMTNRCCFYCLVGELTENSDASFATSLLLIPQQHNGSKWMDAAFKMFSHYSHYSIFMIKIQKAQDKAFELEHKTQHKKKQCLTVLTGIFLPCCCFNSHILYFNDRLLACS